MTTKRNPVSYQPTYCIRFCSDVASCNHFFFPLYFSFYLSHLLICPILPDFSSFQSPFLRFFSHFLFYFLLPVFIYFVIYFFLVYWGQRLFIHSFFSLLSSFLYFFLRFRKFLNTLNLHFYIKKHQKIGWTEKLQPTFEFWIKS